MLSHTVVYKIINLTYYAAMNLLYRRFIILLLLVLQGFSPLVHAHVQAIDSNDNGIHIDEISRVWYDTGDALSFTNSEHIGTAIDMQAAITQKKLLLDGELLSAIFIGAKAQFIRFFVINKLIGFSPPIFIVKSSISLSAIAPRAPPVI